MPKSKRNKQIELAKTKKRGLEWKKHLYEEVRSCVDSFTNIFVFSVNDMRNSKMKNVREQWKDSRFFIGKNKIMAMAVGRSVEAEYRPNLHKIGQEIKGQCGLLFSNKSTEEVLSWFRSYSEGDYARSGNVSTEDVKLSAGPLSMFPHSLEPYLRQLGLPTSLVKGVIHLVKDHEVCKAGDTLTPETAKILKLLGYEMAEFHITIECMWSHDGSFMQLSEKINVDTKENIKKGKKKSLNKKAKEISEPPAEEMEVEMVENSDQSEVEKAVNNSDVKIDSDDIDAALNTVENTSTSTPKVTNEKETNLPQVLVSSDIAENKIKETVNVYENKTCDVLHEDTVNRKGRPKSQRLTQKKKKDSLPKTPDANTSQDSPIYRELRTRSVKVNRKRK